MPRSQLTNSSAAVAISIGFFGPAPRERSRSSWRAWTVAKKRDAEPSVSVIDPARLDGRSGGPSESTALSTTSWSRVSLKLPSLRQPVTSPRACSPSSAAGSTCGEIVGAGIGRAAFALGDDAVGADRDRPLAGGDVGLDPERAILEPAAGGDLELRRRAIGGIAALDPPWAGQRARLDGGGDVA